MSLAKQISQNIAEARRGVGLSQAELGFRLHAASQEISRLESGRVCPRLTTLLRVARALEVPLTDLVDGIE
ncbi:MAG: helix-turn-helix domain-containing protein [Solirubrobacterales bacterium]